MSVYVSVFSSPTEWTVTHDDAGHSGTIDPTTVIHPQNIDGSSNYQFMLVTCPVCGAVSTHPVGGGAQPAEVQEMFARVAQRTGCPCAASYVQGRPIQLTAGHVKLHTEQQDGKGRWQVPPLTA